MKVLLNLSEFSTLGFTLEDTAHLLKAHMFHPAGEHRTPPALAVVGVKAGHWGRECHMTPRETWQSHEH